MLGHHVAGEGLQHRHGHVLAFAGLVPMAQRRQGGDDREQAAGLVRHDGGQGAEGRVGVHELLQPAGPAGRLDQIVERLQARIRTSVVIAHRLDIDDVRPDRLDVGIGETQARHGGGAHVVDEDVAGRHQLAQDLLVRVGLQVEGDGALVAVQRHIGGAHLLGVRRLAGVALAVAARLLDLDHVGAEIPEGLGGVGAEHELGQVYNAQAVQGAFRLVVWRRSIFHRGHLVFPPAEFEACAFGRMN